MGKHRDWTEIRDDYQLNGLSYAKLAAKYNVPIDTLKKAAARQGWTNRKAKKEKILDLRAGRVSKAVRSVEMAPEENGTFEMALRDEREDLSPEERFQRVVCSLLYKVEASVDVISPDNAKALRALSGALKDLASLKGWDKDEYDRAEQQARIDKLRAETESAKREESGEIQIRIMGMSEEDIEEVIG